jgi:hypothetical protein
VPLVGRFYAAGAVQTHFLEVEDEHTRLTARFAVLGEVSLAFWRSRLGESAPSGSGRGREAHARARVS